MYSGPLLPVAISLRSGTRDIRLGCHLQRELAAAGKQLEATSKKITVSHEINSGRSGAGKYVSFIIHRLVAIALPAARSDDTEPQAT